MLQNMKTSKVLIIVSAFMLLTGLSSCKKKQPSESTEAGELDKIPELISNPISEISCADPSIVKHDGKYYIYATVDPWGGEELVVLESSDFKNWERKHIQWPNLEDCASPTSGGPKYGLRV